MSAAFLRDITENIRLAAAQADIAGYVAYAPAGMETLFDGVLAAGTQLVLADGTGDMPNGVVGFGRSLLHATRALFERGHSAVCVLNSDSPTLADRMPGRRRPIAGRRASRRVGRGGRWRLLPARHAGGEPAPLQRHQPGARSASPRETRAAAGHAGLAVHELPEWYDVDDRAALGRLIADLDGGAGYPAPATASLVAALGLRGRLSA